MTGSMQREEQGPEWEALGLRSPEPGLFSARVVDGPGCPAEARPGLLIEVAHGATRTAHFRALAERLRSELPERLEDFFHVNTDVGAPELARALARGWAARGPRRALVIECEIPRTLIDTNRVIDGAAAGMTPGLMPWVTDPEDVALLRGLHARYVSAVDAAVERVCGGGGLCLLAHSYAPRSVDVSVGPRIVAELRAAWTPGQEGRWPLRAEVDLLTADMQGREMAPLRLVSAVERALQAGGVEVKRNHTYALHPSTQGYRHAQRYPDRVLSFEIRRDLVAEPWDPFAEMVISPDRVRRLAGLFLSGIEEGWDHAQGA